MGYVCRKEVRCLSRELIGPEVYPGARWVVTGLDQSDRSPRTLGDVLPPRTQLPHCLRWQILINQIGHLALWEPYSSQDADASMPPTSSGG